MKCPKCRNENTGDAKFCNACGAVLELSCLRCSSVNPGGSRFCSQCGSSLASADPEPAVDYSRPESYTPAYLAEKILTSRNAIEGERKQVSVLFCDITNSTALAEGLGSEAFHDVLNRFFESCLSEVHALEGTVNQFLGDGFMALFGAPIACEDHARRAVLAALGIRKKIDGILKSGGNGKEIRLELRMGINTGSVVVGAVGDNLRMDYTAVGDTTNIAARLQQTAEPGQVLISGSTRHAVRGYYRLRKIGDRRLKGKAEKVSIWEVAAARKTSSRLDEEVHRDLTQFVGRSRELEKLQESFEIACSGQGQVVSIVGEAGIGKSRLLLEFRRQLGEKDAKWLEGHAVSFGKLMAFHPLIDLFKRIYHIEENDPEEKIVEKITWGVRSIGDELTPMIPYLRYLLTMNSGDAAVQAMAPQLRHREIFRSLRNLLVRASAVRPQVLVFEDLHWFDRATEESLVYLANSIHNSRVLVICTYRPGYTNPIGDRTYHRRIVLPVMPAADSLAMARSMLAAADLPQRIQRLIVNKAEGNPLFVEEIVRSLREVGVVRRAEGRFEMNGSTEDIHVSATIQDVLMARIDRLADEEKRILQMAAVVGREFSDLLIDRLSGLKGQSEKHLQELEKSALIEAKHLFPELVYQFNHALTQEVAYRSLLKQRRKEMHRRIGRVMEDLYRERLDEFYEVLAYHFARGGEWRKALDYFCKAGEKASRSFAIRDAIALYDQALEAAGRVGNELPLRIVMEIYKAKSDLCYGISEFKAARSQGKHLLEIARKAGDRAMEGAALAKMGWAATYAHDFDQALEDADRAIEIGQETKQKPVVARGRIVKGHVYYVTGRIQQAKPELEKAHALCRSANDEINLAAAHRMTALGNNWEGRFAEGAEHSVQGIRIAKKYNLVMVLIQCIWTHGIISTGSGDYPKAYSLFHEGLDLAEKAGEEAYHFRLLNGLGWLLGECGDLDSALEYNQQSAELGRKRGDPEIIANAELNLADIYLTREEWARARRHLDYTYRLASDASTSQWMKWRYTIHLLTSYAEFLLARGDLDKAEQLARQCLKRSKKTASHKYLVKGLRVMGEIYDARGESEEAEGWLRNAVSIARALGNPTQLYKATFALGRVHAGSGSAELAFDDFEAARRVVTRVKKSLVELNLDRHFSRLPVVEQVTEKSRHG